MSIALTEVSLAPYMGNKCSMCCPCRCWNYHESSCCCNMLFFDGRWICYATSHQVGRTENEGLCIFGLPKLSSLYSARRVIACGRRTYGTWDHHLCHPWSDVSGRISQLSRVQPAQSCLIFFGGA